MALPPTLSSVAFPGGSSAAAMAFTNSDIGSPYRGAARENDIDSIALCADSLQTTREGASRTGLAPASQADGGHDESLQPEEDAAPDRRGECHGPPEGLGGPPALEPQPDAQSGG